jgi:hypothetical protein
VGDGSAALDNYRIVRAFMERYPQYAKNDLYLASESYGGHYIPMLAKVMVDKEAALAAEQQLNFKGFMIGNPYNNPGENNYGSLIAFWGHQLLPLSLWEVRNDVGSTHGKTRACRRIAASISSLHALLVVVGKLKEGKMMLVFPTAKTRTLVPGPKPNCSASTHRRSGTRSATWRGSTCCPAAKSTGRCSRASSRRWVRWTCTGSSGPCAWTSSRRKAARSATRWCRCWALLLPARTSRSFPARR